MQEPDNSAKTGGGTEENELGSFVTFRLNRISAKLGAQARRFLLQIGGISLSQYRVIVMIGQLGTTSFTEIVQRTSLDRGTTSRTISGLIDQGLIVAHGDERDQRSQNLALTDRGQHIYQEIWPKMQARQRFLLSRLEPTELAALHSALDKLEIAADAKEFGE